MTATPCTIDGCAALAIDGEFCAVHQNHPAGAVTCLRCYGTGRYHYRGDGEGVFAAAQDSACQWCGGSGYVDHRRPSRRPAATSATDWLPFDDV